LSKNFTMTLLLHQSPISPHSLKTLFYSWQECGPTFLFTREKRSSPAGPKR
jgi:hypothetical protein